MCCVPVGLPHVDRAASLLRPQLATSSPFSWDLWVCITVTLSPLSTGSWSGMALHQVLQEMLRQSLCDKTPEMFEIKSCTGSCVV